MELLPYQSDWKKKFDLEKEHLKRVFGEAALEIEHIGSTAIPGLSAKPIIDIAVMIEDHKDAESFTQPLVQIGYAFHSNSTERHFYRMGNPVAFHLSIAYADQGGFWPRQILFRDYLRMHPEFLAEYENIKKDLIEKYPIGDGGYSEGKTRVYGFQELRFRI